MSSNDGITRYDAMPIPPVEAQTEYFEASPIVFGVEYRLLDDSIALASETMRASGDIGAGRIAEDRGVALHVFGENAGERLEYLRFDCFDEDPHYHYVSWKEHSNEMIHIDPVAVGDPLGWALERIRTRLPQMLERAGAPEVAQRVDARRVEAVLPKVAEAAYRARFHHDAKSVRRDAIARRGAGGAQPREPAE